MKPLIGILSRLQAKNSAYAIGETYIDAICKTGGIPIQIPVKQPEDIGRFVSMIDGLVVPGGADVAPLFYGEQPHPKVNNTCRRNDDFEAAFIKAAIGQKKPILAICRGIQLLNVSLGGTLYQDIPTETENRICHRQETDMRGEMTHTVSVVEGSWVHKIVGTAELPVNSYHHQAVKRAADGLRIAATAPDGIIEAVESGDGMVIGVQWHPEILVPFSEAHAAFFAHLVDCCRK